MNRTQLSKALSILVKARNNLCYDDYVEIWGEHLGKHIWYQECSDLLRIWSGGLTFEQKEKFVKYILKKFGDNDGN